MPCSASSIRTTFRRSRRWRDVQFDLDMVRAKPPNGLTLAAGSMLHTRRVGDVACKYRTCYPVTLWPVTLAEAKLQPPPFPSGTAAPARAVAALRLRFETPGRDAVR